MQIRRDSLTYQEIVDIKRQYLIALDYALLDDRWNRVEFLSNQYPWVVEECRRDSAIEASRDPRIDFDRER